MITIRIAALIRLAARATFPRRGKDFVVALVAILFANIALAADSQPASRPNIVLILADDLGYSDLGCYGSDIATPNLDALAARGLRFTQFYNAARCCPTRAALLTGQYPHAAGVGHMLQQWKPPHYTDGIGPHTATYAELLRSAGYRTYHVGKWHVGGVGGKTPGVNHPLGRGFDRAYGTGGGGSFFDLKPLYLDDQPVEPGPGFYATDAFTEYAVKFVEEHGRDGGGKPFLLNLCYTAPHFPLHAKPADIEKYRGHFDHGWDRERERRFARQKEMGFFAGEMKLSPRDPVAKPWDELSAEERAEYARRMEVHAAMIDCMDQGIGRVLAAIDKLGATDNTLVLFLSDNGASAEALDSWPNPARGHKPGSVVGTAESHRCLEVGWATAANTPFRMHKMWIHEGGISTPLIAAWPRGIAARGSLSKQVGHVIDLSPTFVQLAGATYPQQLAGRELRPQDGQSLAPAFADKPPVERTLGWEHEGNRGLRMGDWKVVSTYEGPWELYNLGADRTETVDLAAREPARLRQLTDEWQQWGDKVGVTPWKELPGANYKPSAGYRKKSEPVGE